MIDVSKQDATVPVNLEATDTEQGPSRGRALPGARSRSPRDRSRSPRGQQPNPQEARRVIIDPVILKIYGSDGDHHEYRIPNKTNVGVMLRFLSNKAYWGALPLHHRDLYLIEAPRPFLRLAPDFQPNRMCVISNRPNKMDD